MRVYEIYEAYRLMPFLQQHQLRVAAVGSLVCDAFEGDIDRHAVVLASLFHDMGNIIKSDLTVFPQSLEPLGLAYWQGVKQDFVEKYGENEHHATIEIGKEIGLPEPVLRYMDGVGFSKLERIRDSASFEQKIVEYGDLRVAPYGIVSFEDRQTEARQRYTNRKHGDFPEDDGRYEQLLEAGREIERQIFARAALRPEDITDEAIAPLLEALKDLEISKT